MTPAEIAANLTPADALVSRYCTIDPVTNQPSGDFLRVGRIDFGEFRDLVDAEFQRAGSAFHMRPMWFTGSPFGAEILALAAQARGRAVLAELDAAK
jgi:hypothetical protein